MLEQANRVARLLHEAGGVPLAVGGFVRDEFLGLESKDLDVEVHGLDLQQVHDVLAPHFPVDAVGASFGVLKVHVGLAEPLDVSVPRKETKTGAGHKGFDVQVDAHMGFADAFRRRDLTLNAMGRNLLTGELVDLFGGLSDLQAGVLNAVDPETFVEDPLRALRVAQFAARFGFTPSQALTELCSQLDLSEVPASRVETEFTKLLLKGKQPSKGLFFLHDSRLLAKHFPQLSFSGANKLQSLCDDLDASVDKGFSLEQLLALLLAHTSVANAEVLVAQLNTKKKTQERALALRQGLSDLAVFSGSRSDVRRLALAQGNLQELLDLAQVFFRDCPHLLESLSQVKAVAQEEGVLTSPPVPLVKAQTFLDLGVKPGPQLGQLLKEAFEAQLDGVFSSEAGAVAFAVFLVQAS